MSLSSTLLPLVETEMQRIIARLQTPSTEEMHHMIAYHMGWEGEGAGPKAQGKRIRPLLVLLSYGAAIPPPSHLTPDTWHIPLPAAASVEILHNFSLIHDDIQDNSPLRRGRPTVWQKWGIAQAINAGDAEYTLAFTAMLELGKTTEPAIALEAINILQNTCIALTQGQYLDMSFETRSSVSLDEYWTMIGGKTAALTAACTELGALIAGVDDATRAGYREFGRYLGLAFQVQDDLLGIWGDAALTGKSTESDLVAGKKSIPVVYGFAQDGPFAARWAQGPIQAEEVAVLANQLEKEGARAYTQKMADELTGKAVRYLQEVNPRGEAGAALVELANMLLQRQV
ncbi:MAG: polyprenyl synthetase family protein [Anaerolineales bacterium]|nr:polyprenyl synthetase family protein [Anaerolineales bacterium]